MRALTVVPGRAGSGALSEVPEPAHEDGAILVEGLALGICGTDAEILSGDHGSAPPGDERLILGHESLGRVVEAPEACGFSAGDLVVGIVRRPDPEPCPCCAAGQWDMCRNGRYTERGIKARHGYGAERWRVEPEFCVRVDDGLGDLGVLLEPASVLAKAWTHIDEIAARACFGGRRVLVAGAGPVGLLAAIMAVQRGFELHVIDLVEGGPKPRLVEQIGGTYHPGASPGDVPRPDVCIDATGVPDVVLACIEATGPNGITCLTGLGGGRGATEVDLGALNRAIVLENDVIFGSVNANRRHYEAAARALAAADREVLAGMITRRVPLSQWEDAVERREDDVKVVVDLTR